jgi:hypothetical protein
MREDRPVPFLAREGQPCYEGSFDSAGNKTGEWKCWLRDGSVDVKNAGTYELGKRVK